MSSRVNLGLLIGHIEGLPKCVRNLYPELKFKILYSSSNSTALPIEQHFPESFFSFDVYTSELRRILSQSQSLHGKVQSAFTNKLSAYAALLQRETFEVPKDVLYVLLPFLHGDALTEPMLNGIVAAVGELMRTTTTTTTTMTTTTTSSSETTKKSRKRAKRG